jgi:small subunit ribosomal protein S1
MNHDDKGRDAFSMQEVDATAHAADSRPVDRSEVDDADIGMEDLLRESDFSFRRLRRGETVEGTVVRVDPDEILVDIGLKSEGVIPAREFLPEDEEIEPLHVGDRTLVYVLQPETAEGSAVLSLRRARMERSWREIEELYQQGRLIEGPVVDFNKGGLIVDVKGVRGFVPVSQVLDLRNISRQEGEGSDEISQTLAAMKGRRLPLKIIEINRSRNRLILSERAAVQERRTQKKDELLEDLQEGQIRKGVVSNLTTFGAFVDLGGADGLVHVSELSYNRVNHPGEVLKVGQEVSVYVLSVDRDTKKIALSLKRALPDPWTLVDQKYHIGQVVPATITKLAKFGAFAQVEEGLEGLIHLSELTDMPVTDAAQVVSEGQPVNVKIIHINSQRRRLGLSVRQARESIPYSSYGTVDTTSPFASEDFGFYTESDYPSSAPYSLEEEHPADVQDSPDVELEPNSLAATESASAVASDDVSPMPTEAQAINEEEQQPPVASAASQGGTNE